MADKPALNTFSSGARIPTTELNENFELLAQAIQDSLGRGGTAESPNSMQGTLDMDLNRIQNLPAPSLPKDAANKQYVDGIVTSLLPGSTIVSTSKSSGNAVDWDAINSNTIAAVVETYTELKNTTPFIDGDGIIVLGRASAGDKGGGIFRWSSSNLAAQVTADTASGIYVPLTGEDGTTGAWVRQYGNTLHPEWFGCVGDGVTNDFTAFVAAHAMLQSGQRMQGLSPTYLVTASSAAAVVVLDSLTDIDIDFMNSHIDCSGQSIPALFQLQDSSRVQIDCSLFENVATNMGPNPPTYSGGFLVRAYGVCEGIAVNKRIGLAGRVIGGNGLFRAVQSELVPDSGGRSSNIQVEGTTYRSQYGVNLAFSGDNTHVNISCETPLRSLFVYGVKGVRGKVKSVDGRGANININNAIAATPATTEDVDIIVDLSDDQGSPIQINAVNSVDVVRDIKIKGLINNPLNYINIAQSALSGSLFENIELDLVCDGESNGTLSSRVVLVGPPAGVTVDNLKFSRLSIKRFTNASCRPLWVLSTGTKTNFQLHNYYADAGELTEIDGVTDLSIKNFYCNATARTAAEAHLSILNSTRIAINTGKTVGIISETGNTSSVIGGDVWQGASDTSNGQIVGSWTPVLIGLTDAGVGTYTTQVGTYVQTGKIVNYTFALTWTAHTGTGGMRVTGLPFNSTATATLVFPGILLPDNITFAGSTVVPAVLGGGNAYVNIYNTATGASAATLAMDTAGTLWCSGWYQID